MWHSHFDISLLFIVPMQHLKRTKTFQNAPVTKKILTMANECSPKQTEFAFIVLYSEIKSEAILDQLDLHIYLPRQPDG